MAVVVSGKRRREEAEEEEEDFNSKRPRTDDAVYIRTTTWEQVESVTARLFKWNETSALEQQFPESGVVFFQFNTYKDDSGVAITDTHCFMFDLLLLGRGSEDNMRGMLEDAIGRQTGRALNEHQVKGLAEQVVTYLSSNFRFTRRSLSSARKSTLVLVIEVDLFTVEERRVLEIGDLPEDHDHRSLEEEYGDRLEQPSAEFDQFEADSDSSEETLGDETLGEEDDEDQSLVDSDHFEGNSMEFDSTEETLGEEEDDEDHSFVGSDQSEDNYVESDTEETGEAEEEQPSVDFDHSEDNYVELNTEETGEEVDMLTDHTDETQGTEEYDYDGQNLDQPFGNFGSASDYAVVDHTDETQGEAAAAEDFYQFEPDTEEIGEEEDEEEDTEETSSDPELIKIEDALWKLTDALWKLTDALWRLTENKGSIHFVSKVDRDRSRDSRCLKQVKGAMEIIKEFPSNDKEADSCSLCLGGLAEKGKAVARTRCSHLFHSSCLCSWLSRKDSCPLCRSKCCTVV